MRIEEKTALSLGNEDHRKIIENRKWAFCIYVVGSDLLPQGVILVVKCRIIIFIAEQADLDSLYPPQFRHTHTQVEGASFAINLASPHVWEIL